MHLFKGEVTEATKFKDQYSLNSWGNSTWICALENNNTVMCNVFEAMAVNKDGRRASASSRCPEVKPERPECRRCWSGDEPPYRGPAPLNHNHSMAVYPLLCPQITHLNKTYQKNNLKWQKPSILNFFFISSLAHVPSANKEEVRFLSSHQGAIEVFWLHFFGSWRVSHLYVTGLKVEPRLWEAQPCLSVCEGVNRCPPHCFGLILGAGIYLRCYCMIHTSLHGTNQQRAQGSWSSNYHALKLLSVKPLSDVSHLYYPSHFISCPFTCASHREVKTF